MNKYLFQMVGYVLLPIICFSQQKTLLKGKVIDENGYELVGVSIRNQVLNNFASTDSQGQFSINISENDTLLISSIGYQEKRIAVDTLTKLPITILLNRVSNELSDVIVSTGYQEIAKERATGSFVQIDNELLNRSVGSNIIDRLKDVAPGLSFNNTYPYITVRGISTIHANMEPLIILDNFPYEDDINNINPDDVESITILKDAAAASIWGARAGNGVIVINTKKGNPNQPARVSVSSNLSIGGSKNLFYTPQMSIGDYVDTEKKLFAEGYYQTTEDHYNKVPLSPVVELLIAKRDNPNFAAEADLLIEEYKNYDLRNDVSKYLQRNSIDQRHALSIAGGAMNNRYYVSAGYDKSEGNTLGMGTDRLSLNAKNTFVLLKEKVTINTNVSFSKRNESLNGSGVAYGQYPYERLVDDNGSYLPITHMYRQPLVASAHEMGLLNWEYVPNHEIENNDNRKTTNNSVFGASLKYQIQPALSVEGFYQYIDNDFVHRDHNSLETFFTRNSINRITQFKPDGSATYPIPLAGILDMNNVNSKTNTFRTHASYNNNWQEHRLNAIGGWEMSDRNTEGHRYRHYGYDDEYAANEMVDYLTAYPLSFTTRGIERITRFENLSSRTNRFISYYANAAYSYKDLYTLSASARKDQSNVFGVEANLKGVPLYSIGASWNIHNEGFYSFESLAYLRVRGTFGYNGNMDNTLSSSITAKYEQANASFLPRATIINPPNKLLRWERVRTINLGLDFAIKKQVLNGSIDYYKKDGFDLLGEGPLPESSGLLDFKGNTANTKGNGLEFSLNSLNVDRRYKWTSNLNLSYSKSIISKYLLDDPTALTAVETGTGASPVEGYSRYSVFSFPWAGLDPETGRAQGYHDNAATQDYVQILNHTPLEDIIYHGSRQPIVFGSFRNTISWRNLSLSANIGFRLGYYVRFESIYYGNNYGLGGHGDIYKRWMEPGDEKNTQVPSMPTKLIPNEDRFYRLSSQLIEKGDHVRLNDIRLAYSIPNSQFSQKVLKKMEVYAYANNVALLWVANSRGVEPDNASVPVPFNLSFGLKIEL